MISDSLDLSEVVGAVFFCFVLILGMMKATYTMKSSVTHLTRDHAHHETSLRVTTSLMLSRTLNGFVIDALAESS